MVVSSEFRLGDAEVETFDRDGFVIVEDLVDPDLARRALDRYADLFAGSFETGLYPDEWNWRQGVNAPDLTRQICNAWKSDREIARVVLRPDIGRACARLGGWPGARLSQDNVLWKPPGGKALGFHQDSSYEQWAVPSEWVSCWIALEDTTAAQGTVEYVRGSHRWSSRWGMIEQFHGPVDPHAELRHAAAAHGWEPEFVPVEVPAGGGAFHHGWTWHGSDVNRSASATAVPGSPLHVLGGSLPSRDHRLPLQSLQAVRRRRHGRIVLPDHLEGRRLPITLPRSLPAARGRMGGRADPGVRRVKVACSNKTAGHSPQLTPEGESAGVVTLMSSLGSNRLGTASGAGAVSVGSPVSAVTRSRSPAPPKRRKRRRRLEPNTITSAPKS